MIMQDLSCDASWLVTTDRTIVLHATSRPGCAISRPTIFSHMLQIQIIDVNPVLMLNVDILQ